MKKWLMQTDEEGISNLDAITMAIGVFLAFIIPIILIKCFY